MKRLVVKQHRAFTLVEIMVTMAILVVMMSFLFQFVLGAQRVWSGTTKDMEMFEQAQVIFDVMEKDLKNMICEVPKDNPDGGMQIYLDTVSSGDDENRLNQMCFMTSYVSEATEDTGIPSDNNRRTKRVGVYPVCYQLIPIFEDAKPPFRLYRYNCDRIVKNNKSPFFAYANDNGSDTPSDETSFKNMLKVFKRNALKDDEKDELRELVSEEIETLKVQFFPEKKDGYLLTKKPISVKLTVKLRQKEQIKQKNSVKTPEMRTFTKIVFVE